MRSSSERIAKNLVLAFLAITTFFVWSPIPKLIKQSFAADLTEAAMRLDRMSASQSNPNILVLAKPATADTEDDLFITFNASFGINGVAANISGTTANLPSTFNGESITAWPGLGTSAIAVSGQSVTYSSGDLSPGTLYGFFIGTGVTNPSSANTYTNTIATRTGGDVVIDSKVIAVDVVTSNADQVSVGATVPSTFNFALDNNTVNFGSLSSGSVNVGSTVNVDVDTNASSGWTAWISSANQGLDSASTADTIDTSGTVDGGPTTVTSGSDFYQLDIEVTNGSGSGTPAVAAEYDGQHGDPYEGGTFASSLTEIATSTGPGSNDGIALFGIAAMVSTKQAASDYIDTWTVVGAANF